MANKRCLEGMVAHYERILDGMAGHVFFVQDDDGALRRWFPPRKLLLPKEANQ